MLHLKHNFWLKTYVFMSFPETGVRTTCPLHRLSRLGILLRKAEIDRHRSILHRGFMLQKI